MIPFKLPAWRKRQIADKFRRKNRVVTKAVRDMEKAMRTAVEFVVDQGIRTGHFHEPTLNEMFMVSEEFYRSVVTEAVDAAKYEKQDMAGRKNLARLPTGLPRRIKNIDQIFKDKRYWRRIMSRSKKLTERLKKQYLAKLRKQFEVIMPKIQAGEISPVDAKKAMVEVWETSKSRVETIFRTETTKYFAQTQVNFFKGDPEIIGFLFDSVRDLSRTEICRSRHGLIFKPNTKLLDENTPPCHYNCRSHLIALANTEHNRKLLGEEQRNPANVRLIPLPPDWR